MDITTQIRDFIVDAGRWFEAPEALTTDLPLIERGVLDSMAIFELVSFIEDRFDVEIEDDELVLESFETLGAISRLVASKPGL